MRKELRRLIVPVLAALRTYWRTALLLAFAAALGLSLLLQVTTLSGPDGLGGGSRLRLWPAPGPESGLAWSTLSHSVQATGQLAVSRLFELLLLGAGFALMVAGLTILTFSAAREGEREVELSIRRAVGASRRVLLGSALVESAVLIAGVLAVGGGLGALLAALALHSWPGMLGPSASLPSLPAAVVIAGGIVFGAIVPVLFARRKQVLETVGRPLPLAIPAVQLGLSLVVLTAGTLVARHALGDRQGGATPPAAERTVYRIGAGEMRARERAVRYAALIDRLHAVPESLASLSSPGTLVGLGTVDMVITDCGDCWQGGLRLKFRQIRSTHLLVTADTFLALDVHLVAGRLLTDADRMGTERVVVVNRSMAADNFQHGEALGRQLKVADDIDEWYTVVGIVDDPVRSGFGAGLQPPYTVYLSLLQHPAAAVELLVPRPGGNGDAALRSALGATVGPAAAGAPALREADLLGLELMPVRWLAQRFAVEGWGMLLLATGAVLALMRLWVASLRTELGLRLALGATRRRLLAMVIGRTLWVGVAGVGVGIWFGPALWTGLRELLPGLPRWDPLVLLGYAAVLMAAAMAGAVWPALRALRHSPAELFASEGA
jgi:hypothetical protein